MALDPMMAMMMLGGMGGGYSPEQAAVNPFGTGGGATTSMARQLAPLRAMSYINRDARMGMQVPRSTRSGAGNRFLPGGQAADGMDYSQFTFDPDAHAAASKFLGQYGLSPLAPSQVQQNTVLPNTGFFGNHPRLSRMLEGGIYGAAASQGSNTWGEGIQSVANSLIAGPRMQAAAYQQQFEKPFQAARMLEGMEDVSQKRELTEAEIQRTRAQTQALQDKPDAMDKVTHIFQAPSGEMQGVHESGKVTSLGPGMEKPASEKLPPGLAKVYNLIGARGYDPTKPLSPAQWKVINSDYVKEQQQIASDRTGAATAARIQQQHKLGDKLPVDVQNRIDTLKKSWLDPKNKELRSSLRWGSKDANGKTKLLSEPEIDNAIAQRNMQTSEQMQKEIEDYIQSQNSPIPQQ